MPLDVSSGHRQPGGPAAPARPAPGARGGGDNAVVARRRRFYKRRLTASFPLRTWRNWPGRDTDDEPVRSDGPSPLGPVAAAAVRDDQRPGHFFSTLGQETEQQIDDLATELAGDDQPGEDYLAKAAG